MQDLTPRAIVRELDKYIIGQAAAKRAVAVALRNRQRRQMVQGQMAQEIRPKNILMIGPTGVGKTEIARRVAQLLDAPFIRVEATQFTEVGYVGRDVESIVHELAEVAVNGIHDRKMREVEKKAERLAAERILGYLCQQMPATPARPAVAEAVQASLALGGAASPAVAVETAPTGGKARLPRTRAVRSQQRKHLAEMLANRQLEDTMIEIELSSEGDGYDAYWEYSAGGPPDELAEGFGEPGPPGVPHAPKRRRRVSVKEARRLLAREEAYKLIDFDDVVEEATKKVETSGVVFIDELDKVAGAEVKVGPDVSGEGVQRDLLPIVEGCTIMTRYGPVKTDHVLFIAAGSFYQSKPSDLIPELQGRFPLRVELDSLSQADMERILTEPENALTKQYQALLATEGVELEFAPDGVAEIAAIACAVNQRTENIGARRLHTIVERVLEDVSFEAPERQGERVVVDREFVRARLANVLKDEDLSRYIL